MPHEDADHGGTERQTSRLLSLEIIFLTVIGLVVLAAFVEAFSYRLVSSRTPFVMMVPLIILIGVQAMRLFREGALDDVRRRSGRALTGEYPGFNKLMGLGLWLLLALAMIWAFGHYIGIAALMFWLMRVVARERLALTVIVVGVTTGVIYLLFEQGFQIELYRGLLFRWLGGYRDF